MIKKILFLIAVFVFQSPTSVIAQKTKWTVDSLHTSVKFSAKHLGLSLVAGQFTSFEGSMMADKLDFTDAKFDFVVTTNSINTNVAKRDEDLRSANFFEVNKYPQMTFKSTGIRKLKGENYLLTGILTIKDVSKTVTLKTVFHKAITDPWGNTRTGLRAVLTINRFDYHINQKETFGNNQLQIASDIQIFIDMELIKDRL
ncbi:YceI family protein [Flavobacterium sp. W1B]|uniref:YceI family protein n=1 Tax=Flavobacterium sp. W1B TaxID=3394146 RepID=UPI0039BC89D9